MLTPLRILVSAPSATGKDTLLDNIRDKLPKLYRTKSWTTKPPDSQKKYRHVTKDEFMAAEAQGHFLESNMNFEHFYGTYIADVPPGMNTISDMDAQAALNLKKTKPNIHTIFIVPPDFATLERRHTQRGRDTAEQIQRRLQAAHAELELARQFDFYVVNDDITNASRRLFLLIALLLQRTPPPSSFRDFNLLESIQQNFRENAAAVPVAAS